MPDGGRGLVGGWWGGVGGYGIERHSTSASKTPHIIFLRDKGGWWVGGGWVGGWVGGWLGGGFNECVKLFLRDKSKAANTGGGWAARCALCRRVCLSGRANVSEVDP